MGTAARRVLVPTALLSAAVLGFWRPVQPAPLTAFERRLVGTWACAQGPRNVPGARSFTTLTADRRYSHTLVTADGQQRPAGSGTWMLNELAERNVLEFHASPPKLTNAAAIVYRLKQLGGLASPRFVTPLSFTFDSEDRFTATGGMLSWDRSSLPGE